MFDRILADLAEVNELPEFPQFYLDYVFQMQDEQIEAEIRYMFSHNVMDTLTIQRMLDESIKGMASLCPK